MTQALIILHAGPDLENPRADTAVRLAGAMLADNKDVRLFLAGQGVQLLRPSPMANDSTRALLGELLELGLEVQCCGSSLKAQAMETLPPGVHKSSMKGLSTWISAADEIVCF
ncbi:MULTISPECIES: DsrE family protein [Acidithiobacillus]|uniref:Sulfur reduction protein DsrE n=2 Tax=Acidithiobacillus TaxID=119977 RepID=A0A5P9XPT5_ACITH|nr:MULTISPECIES: DsrE family protein [Acidithiobacillus]MBU2717050.1 DsrE family protein [Acidithiobacillus ferridurans]MBU2723051.1 DsrE family protein [Acidithiobacillus ferridurans]MBU2725115.1 DsrE family protein [Acidithiobacillus ferridurans]MBU2749598.1 DsrE family protein [Acidithiobacillus thiooxidans]QFX95793.1 sulfur reduction protein DsrE [Acidithiobacillus thiooxidans ATCC 19377]